MHSKSQPFQPQQPHQPLQPHQPYHPHHQQQKHRQGEAPDAAPADSTKKREYPPLLICRPYKPLRLRQLGKSNSTSSIFCTANICEPNLTEILSAVATMLHCQMLRDADATERKKKMLPYFCEEMYTDQVSHEIPSVKTVYQFLKHVFEVGQFNPECCVISLVYVNRLIGVTGVPLTQYNWKPVSISALVLAQKVWDDTPLINADFSILYPVLSVREINNLERHFLELLDFKLTVSPSLYAQYYFELRSICEENNIKWRLPGKEQLARVAVRTHLAELYQREKANFKKRTMTVEDMRMPLKRQIIS